MTAKKRKTTVDLTKTAQKVKDEYIHLGLRRILSAGLVLFGKATESEKLEALRQATLPAQEGHEQSLEAQVGVKIVDDVVADVKGRVSSRASHRSSKAG